MEKKDLLHAVDELKKDIENDRITSLIAYGTGKTDVTEHIVCDSITGLGLAKYAEMEMEDKIHHRENTNQIGNFLSKIMNDDD